MARPTKWQPARDGKSETRTSRAGNTVHRQVTDEGQVIEHVNRRDGSSIRAPEPTTDPQNPK